MSEHIGTPLDSTAPTVRCTICPHRCKLAPGQVGICHARSNVGGVVHSDNYGMTTVLALDPIEKKPFYHFHPGSWILSTGSWGCNLACSFCQNSSISLDFAESKMDAVYISPEQLVSRALALRDQGNIGIAFTYNEPTIGHEYIVDTAPLAHENGLVCALVTNGYANEEPWLELMEHIDAANIDLKGFTEEYYRMLGGPGGLAAVKRSIELASTRCHVEVTTLVVPGGNDSPEEMEALSSWLASVDRGIPLHLSRFFPQWHMTDRAATDVAELHALAEIARKHLDHVHLGNV